MKTATWNDLKQEFTNSNAFKMGVRLPKEKSQKGQTLLYLYQNLNVVVNKADAERVICKRLNIPSKDIQSLRHLSKQNGYDVLQGRDQFENKILKKGEYVLTGFNNVNPYWNLSRRDESDLDFDSLKKKYKNCCATCGSKEGKKHRKTGQIVKLEKGHMDPRQAMSSDNIIPQCEHCNKIAKDYFVFDQTGFVKKMTPRGVAATFTKEELTELKEILNHS